MKKAAKWILGILLGLIVLILLVITVGVAYLKPERLTPLVEKVANNYLNAQVSLDRVELTFWHTFPRVEVDVRGLQIKSKSLDKVAANIRSQLPANADSLLRLEGFHAAINLAPLSVGRISLYDITLTKPWINLVQATPTITNWDIVPPSTDTVQETSIPDITIGTFKIEGGMPVSYHSLPDNTSINVQLNTTMLEGKNAPNYSMELNGFTSAQLAGIKINNLRIGAGGKIHWNHKQPRLLQLEDFSLGVGDVNTLTSLTVDLGEELSIDNFKFQLPLTPVKNIVALIPESMRGELAKVKASGQLAVGMELTQPYRPGVAPIPSFDLNVEIPGGKIEYEKLKLHDLGMELNAHVDGNDLNASTVDIPRFHARGQAVDVAITAKVTDVIDDPAVKGTFKGSLNIANLPKKLLSMIPATITGTLTADCDYNLRKSYLTPKKFHRIKLNGKAQLDNFKVSAPMFQAGLFIKEAVLQLGTTGSYHNDKVNVDSMLTASLKIDTIAFHAPGMELQGRGLEAGVGTLNVASSIDTTQINPIGGRIAANKIVFVSQADSSRISLREAVIGGALRRWEGNGRKPLLDLVVKARRAGYRDPMNYASIKGVDMKIKMHPAAPRIGKRMRHRMDSIAAVNPTLDDETLYAQARKISLNERMLRETVVDTAANGQENIDLSVDGSLKSLLRNWDVRGNLKSERVKFFTPYFPLKNVITGLNMDFTTDSLTIHDTHVQTGVSDFTVNGTISNIARALTSKRKKPLEIYFDVKSDTMDINQLAAAVFAGSAFAEHASQGIMTGNDENEKDWEKAVAKAAPIDSASAFVVPMNIDATLNIRGNNVLYSDFEFHDFTGSLMMFDGSINLHKLSASTDMGSANISALYTAPNKKDLQFAFGMQLNDFKINKVMGMIPALDTIMPLLKDISGVINANVAATTRLDQSMNLNIPSLSAAIKLSGDSLVLMDAETFKTVSKWLLFKNKKRNMIDHMNVELTVDSSKMQMYPFMFDIDRYRLGVMGSNDMALNFNYHVAVLKSPLPFRFGINLSGNPDKMKVRLGKAKFNEKNMATVVNIADTTRINLVNQIENIFRRGVKRGGVRPLKFNTPSSSTLSRSNEEAGDTISSADSLYFKNQGLMP